MTIDELMKKLQLLSRSGNMGIEVWINSGPDAGARKKITHIFLGEDGDGNHVAYLVAR